MGSHVVLLFKNSACYDRVLFISSLFLVIVANISSLEVCVLVEVGFAFSDQLSAHVNRRSIGGITGCVRNEYFVG